MGKHVRILGWLQIALGLIDLLVGMAAFGLLAGIGAFTGELVSFGILSVLGTLAGAFMIIMALPNLICGIGLLRGWGSWVLVLAVVLAVFNLWKFPIGTAIAGYTFWIAWKLYAASDESQ